MTKTKKLLFIQGGSRWKFDDAGAVYTDSNFNENVWNRYRNYCDNLTVILRKEEKMYSASEAIVKFNKFNTTKSKFVALPDIYRPVRNAFNFFIRHEIKKNIKEQVKIADKVIIRSLGNLYTNSAIRYCRKYGKLYLVEVTGFAFDGLWYHSLRGKIVAPFKELQYRKMMREVPYAVYVTQNALQKRYPCGGKSLGCSDVELPVPDINVLRKRLGKINAQEGNIIIGTAAFLDVGWKGQEYVIRALAELKNKGFSQFKYQMIGAGEGKRLLQIADRLGVSGQVEIVGALPHDEVFNWMDSIDVYVQSSFQEGLCRSLVEAMSRACPIVCSNVGGNYELASQDNLFKKADFKQLASILLNLSNRENLIKEARRSFEKAKEFDKALLDARRDAFYKEFINA